MLERFRDDASPPRGDLVMVAVPPLREVLRLAKTKKGSKLADEEILQLRDGAVFIVLSSARAAAHREKASSPDLDPQNIIREWRAIEQGRIFALLPGSMSARLRVDFGSIPTGTYELGWCFTLPEAVVDPGLRAALRRGSSA